ncbi:hypothetical protein SAMN05421774_102744 [Gemmobacter megaterium]|uniref:DUF2065 domain-containing protein n=2 Tax=Gemmobacter megaterium TaxID=1086013 RepID=A0A1N7MJL1_9RHOB|nr:hypothetical protein SAMN05421774_102744 [Gemmobacter megaterium]
MMLAVLAIGLVLVVEGLAFALAPSRMEDIVALIARLPVEVRRLLGLAMLAVGVGLVWLARQMGAI